MVVNVGFKGTIRGKGGNNINENLNIDVWVCDYTRKDKILYDRRYWYSGDWEKYGISS